ncbi:isoprenoid synthase domain-containing protein [Lentinula raphanica]|nr:isoprenoid synthase domain-containing protein [Lentinula raphanica]
MAPFTSHPVDSACAPAFFSSFPVISCEPDALPTIQRALNDTIYSCTTPGSKERRKALYRHTNPAGNLFSLAFALSETDRLRYVAQFIEFLCILDDSTENMPFEEACTAHSIIRQALTDKYDVDHNGAKAVGMMKNFLHNLCEELFGLDDPSTALLLKTLDRSLRDRDSDDSEFVTLAEYIPYRRTNFDHDFVCQLLRWGMNVKPEVQESPLLRTYELINGTIVGLTNDYFSWEMERQQPTDRIRNAVPVLMTEHGISEIPAKAMLKEVLIEEERKAEALKTRIMMAELEGDEQVKRYMTGMDLFAAGYSFWCATCPRYHRPQKE